MLLRFIVENYQVFNSEVVLNLEADLRTQKFLSNVICTPQGNVIKSAAIYGPNNTGKTCLLDAIHTYRSVLLNKPFSCTSNLFTESPVTKLGAVFLWNDKRYMYTFRYDTASGVFLEEEFARIVVDQYRNETKKIFFYRDADTKSARSASKDLENVINFSSKDNILINTLDTSEFPLLQEARDVLRGFAESITVVSMQLLQPYKTIELLKDPDSCEAKKIVQLIKSSDLDIDDFKYDENVTASISNEIDEENEKTKGIHNKDKLIEMLKLISIHKGMPLPSIAFDSLGTKKIISLAGYLVDCLNKGGSLFVDELDSSLHFKLSRAVISLFNSSLNNRAQLIFSTHDASLLDIKTLFRKEQIWFTDKDAEQTYLYSLSDFTAKNSGIRLDSNLYEHYSKGLLGALPDPSLIDILIDSNNGACNE